MFVNQIGLTEAKGFIKSYDTYQLGQAFQYLALLEKFESDTDVLLSCEYSAHFNRTIAEAIRKGLEKMRKSDRPNSKRQKQIFTLLAELWEEKIPKENPTTPVDVETA